MTNLCRSAVLLATLASVVAACGRDSEPTGVQQRVVSTGRADGIVVENRTNLPVGYVVIDGHFLGLGALCADPDPGCTRLPAGESVVVPFDQVMGYDGSTSQIIAISWHVKQDAAGGWYAGDIRADTVEFR